MKPRVILIITLLVFTSTVFSQSENGQSNGQGPENGMTSPEVVVTGALNFSAFVNGPAGGTVTVDLDGTRLPPTGDLILVNKAPYSSAVLFDVYARPNSNIAILSTHTNLAGPAGSVMELEVNFSTTQIINNTGDKDTPTPVYMGGTLTVGPNSQDVPGVYSGTVNVTFAYE